MMSFGVLLVFMDILKLHKEVNHGIYYVSYTYCPFFLGSYLGISTRSFIRISIVEVVLVHTIKLQNLQEQLMIVLYLIWVLVAQNLHGATEGSKGIWSMQDLIEGCVI